ncbi:MBL fold metallo-hydrolase [Nakamurella endophytica]|uniref:MBL fold metallo-hydrolase n=1 Tax=Nakamurella endophytica TaxID=1748367 RepID=UPI00166C9802|nr:MBL fold metallo-hydrolase [Nakamurella endophytica]
MLIAGFPAGAFQANCYVVARAAGGPCLVVDPGQDAAARVREMLSAHRLRPAAVLLTHGHLDHVASAAELCRAADVAAHLHPGDDTMLDDPLGALSPDLRHLFAGLDVSDLRPPEVRPLDADLEVAGMSVAVDHTPGHTPGSVVLRLAADGDRPEILFTGDTLFAGSVGRTDLPGGSAAELTRSLQVLAGRPEGAVVLPGHGPTTTIGDERRGNPSLR